MVEQVNAKRSRGSHVRKCRILAYELTIAAGEMTPTLKVKRAVVNQTYAKLVVDMYAEESASRTEVFATSMVVSE